MLALFFEMEGFTVVAVNSGEVALTAIENQPPDIAVVDILLDGGGGKLNGFQTCQALRKNGYERPVIFLTGQTQESDTLQGFAIGGDDYVTKPFSMPVLKARVDAQLKRVGINQHVYRFGTVMVDLKHQLIRHNDDIEHLRNRERELLRCFIENTGRILSREMLLKTVWGSTSRTSNRTVDTHVRTLRKKLRDSANTPQFIETMHGVGYQFIAQADNV